MAPGTATLSPHVSEKEVYDVVQFIYLSIYLSLARKNKKEMDTWGKVGKKRFYNNGSLRLRKVNQDKGSKLRNERPQVVYAKSNVPKLRSLHS